MKTTGSKLLEKGLWSKYCELTGTNEWSMAEGLLDSKHPLDVPAELENQLKEDFKYVLIYDIIENQPFLACQLLEPLLDLTFINKGKESKTRNEFEEELRKNGKAKVVITEGYNKMTIWIKEL